MNHFTTFLQERNLSIATQSLYTRYVEGFLNWYAHDPISCTKKDVLNYLAYLKNKKHYQNITRRNILMAIGYYFTSLQRQELVTINPTSFIKIRGASKRTLHRTFTYEELTQLYDDYYRNYILNFNERCYASLHGGIATNQREKTRLSRQRNYCMLGFLVYQGLHTKELQTITLDNLDLNKAQIHITGTKRINARKLPLNASQIGALMLYLQNTRPQLLEICGNEDTTQLFLPLPEVSKTQTTSTHLMHVLKPLSKQVKNLSTDFTNFKQVRASVITYWIQTLGLRKAQYFAGHRHISSTENYLPNDLESLTDDITKYNPF